VGIEAVEDFLDPTIRKLMPDPSTVTQMEAAAKRIADAAVRAEKVAIFGDYDVDGATSAALLAWHLRHCGLDPLIHIPDRIFEGYGPNTEAVRGLAAKGATLLVTVNRELRGRGFWSAEMPEPDLLGMLHHVALGTVADVAMLVGLNRAFVAKGLIALRRRDHVGHTALMDVARLNGPPEAWHLG